MMFKKHVDEEETAKTEKEEKLRMESDICNKSSGTT